MNNSIFIFLSVALFIASLYLYKKTNPSKVTKGLFFVMAFSSLFLFIAYGIANYFTGNGIDEATLYHLEYGLNGAGFLEYGGLIVTTIVVLILSAICLFWLGLKRKNNYSPYVKSSLPSSVLLVTSLLLNPASLDLYNLKNKSLISTEQPNSTITYNFSSYYRKPVIKASKNKHKNT